MLKRFLFPFIALFCALFFSCSGLINGDEGETVAEHYESDWAVPSDYSISDNSYYVSSWTTGTLSSESNSVIYSFSASYGTTYKIFIRDYYSSSYADVKFSINDSMDFSGTTYVSEQYSDYSSSPYSWYCYTTGTMYLKVESYSSNTTGSFEIAVVTGDLSYYNQSYNSQILTPVSSSSESNENTSYYYLHSSYNESSYGSVSLSESATVSDLLSAVSTSDFTYTVAYYNGEKYPNSVSLSGMTGYWDLYTDFTELLKDAAIYSTTVYTASGSEISDYNASFISDKKYYCFDVSSGSNYFIQWVDRNTNRSILIDMGYAESDIFDGKYTVYEADGTEVLTGDNVSQSFTASTTGTYILCIEPLSSGTSGYVAFRVYSE